MGTGTLPAERKIGRVWARALTIVTSYPKVSLGVILALVLSLGVCVVAHSQEACPATVPNDAACVAWTLPTVNTDGTPIPTSGAAALVEVLLSRGTCNADGSFGTEVQPINLPPTSTSMLVSALPPAKHCFRVRVKNTADVLSAWSQTASKVTTATAPPKPRQPGITVR